MRRIVCALSLAVLAATPARAEELLVAAAVSLREPIGRIAQRFESAHPGTRVQLALGATNALAAQARAGAPIDVLVAADAASLDALAATGLLRPASRATIAGNRLVVIAAADFEAPLARAADLARPELRRLALAGPGVPVGDYARAWLARHALLEALGPRIVPTEHARATLAAVESGDADAAVVYATDARMARAARVAFVVPEAEQPRIVYEAAALARARDPALAEAFVAALRGLEARRELEAAGFLAPPDAAKR
jgi:molybdate transport system substrate-binding protein